jgi:endonuclease G
VAVQIARLSMAKKLLFLLLLFRVSTVFSCDLPDHFDFDVSNDEEILYAGCYDAIHKGPHVIEYFLTKERAENGGIRPSARFTQDRDGGILQNLLSENGYSLPNHSDYTNSGYDRGHMAPNADFNDTYENALKTFFIANIWPQTPAVNRVEWLRTENETRRLAIENMVVKVIIIVDEFSENKVKDIQVPLNFKRRVYVMDIEEPIYEIDVYQY